MPLIRFWRTTAAVSDQITVEQPKCKSKDGFGWPCLHTAHWVVAWTVNPSGLPGYGEDRMDLVCDTHVAERLRTIPYEYAGSATVTPCKEAPVCSTA